MISGRRTVVFGAFKGLGDLLAAAPVILAELNAQSIVAILVHQQALALVELIDFGVNAENLVICMIPKSKSLGRLIAPLRQLAALKPELVMISPHAPYVAASWRIPLIFGILRKTFWRKARLVGAKSERLSALFDERSTVDRNLPLRDREWAAYRLLRAGLENSPPPIRFSRRVLESEPAEREIDLIIHPGAATENKRWPLSYYSEFLTLIPNTYRVAILGLPSDVDPLRSVLPKDRDLRFLSGSLEMALKAIARSRVALTMDSGSMHFANALGVATVSLFGTCNPKKIIPLNENITPLYEATWPCQPCESTRCSQSSVLCMSSISPKVVAERVLALLQQDSRSPRVDKH